MSKTNVPYRGRDRLAVAYIRGGPLAPCISGIVWFEEVKHGTLVTVKVCGLPPFQPAQGDQAPIGPLGFHLHVNGTCQIGDPSDPFQAAGGHYNPYNQPHGNHAGDFPVLFSNDGFAYMQFFTNKFSVADAIGRTVIIHQNPDDYRSQPSGNSGLRLACGVVRPWYDC